MQCIKKSQDYFIHHLLHRMHCHQGDKLLPICFVEQMLWEYMMYSMALWKIDPSVRTSCLQKLTSNGMSSSCLFAGASRLLSNTGFNTSGVTSAPDGLTASITLACLETFRYFS